MNDQVYPTNPEPPMVAQMVNCDNCNYAHYRGEIGCRSCSYTGYKIKWVPDYSLRTPTALKSRGENE